MKKALLAVLVVLVAGCGDQNEPQPATPGTTVLTVAESPGANCADGGLAIVTGIDADEDGTLADDEIESTSYVCNGTAGTPGEPGEAPSLPLVDVSEAITCEETGGVLIRIGADANEDGALQDDEVTEEQTICNGSNATVGPVLIAKTTIEPGPVCGGGGTATQVGHDTDGDGLLADVEVQSQLIECGPCPVDFAQDPADATQCVGVRTLTFEGTFDSVNDPDGLGPAIQPGERFVGEIQLIFGQVPADKDMDGSVGHYTYTGAPNHFRVSILGETFGSNPAAEIDVEVRNDFGFTLADEYSITSLANRDFLEMQVDSMSFFMSDYEGTTYADDDFSGPIPMSSAEQARINIIFSQAAPADGSGPGGPGGPVLGGASASVSGVVTKMNYR